MNELLSFEELSNTRIAEIEAPKPLPIGTYEFEIVSGDFREVESDSEKAPIANANFGVRAVEAMGDVDEDELAATDGAWESETLWHRVPVFNRADRFKVVRFAARCGFDVEDFEGDLVELCKGLKGYRFIAYADHRVVDEDVYVNLKSIQSVGE